MKRKIENIIKIEFFYKMKDISDERICIVRGVGKPDVANVSSATLYENAAVFEVMHLK